MTGTAGGLAGGVLTGMAAEVGAASATARTTAGECRPVPDIKAIVVGAQAVQAVKPDAAERLTEVALDG